MYLQLCTCKRPYLCGILYFFCPIVKIPDTCSAIFNLKNLVPFELRARCPVWLFSVFLDVVPSQYVLHYFFLDDFERIPVFPAVTLVTCVFTFHMRSMFFVVVKSFHLPSWSQLCLLKFQCRPILADMLLHIIHISPIVPKWEKCNGIY